MIGYQAKLDIEEVNIYKDKLDKWIIVFYAPTSTSEKATRKFSLLDIKNSAEINKLKQSTSVGSVQSEGSGWLIILTSAGIYLYNPEMDMLSLGAASRDIITYHSLDDIESASICDVYITSVSPGKSKGFEQYQSKIGNKSIAFSSKIFNLRASLDSRYKYLNAHGGIYDYPPPGSRVVIDQNILIDIYDMVQGGSDGRQYNIEVLLDHILWNKTLETVPGLALIENVANSGILRGKELVAAWEATGIKSILDNNFRENCRGLDNYNLDFNSVVDEKEARDYIISLAYFNLLTSLESWIYLRSKKTYTFNDAICEYRRWVKENNREGIGFSKMRLCVESLFFEKPGSVESQSISKLLKVHRKPPFSIDSLKGAAFDVSLFSYAARLEDGKEEGFAPLKTYIWTADIPLQKFSKFFEIANLPLKIFTDRGEVVVESFSLNFHNILTSKQLDQYKEVADSIEFGSRTRVLFSAFRDVDKLNKKIRNMEAALIDAGIIR